MMSRQAWITPIGILANQPLLDTVKTVLLWKTKELILDGELSIANRAELLFARKVCNQYIIFYLQHIN